MTVTVYVCLLVEGTHREIGRVLYIVYNLVNDVRAHRVQADALWIAPVHYVLDPVKCQS